jgi:dolichol-phosphate mannosyltransferase
MDISVVIPALGEAENLDLLLPELHSVLNDLGIQYEILIITLESDTQTAASARKNGARVVLQDIRGYGRALADGFEAASGEYILTMDADLSHPARFVREIWQARTRAELVIASRYVDGGRAEMPVGRYLLSRILNRVFSRGLSLPVRDMSSGFRLYRAGLVKDHMFSAYDFDILQEILVHVFAEGWSIVEIPFHYQPRQHGDSKARVIKFGRAYLRTFWSLWKLRNSIRCADYDDRAFDSPIWPQRYWQRSRFRHVTEMIAGEDQVLDVGCGSSRIIGALPTGSLAMDILPNKLRYARRFKRNLVVGSGFAIPVRDGAFSCVLCSQVIEHVSVSSNILEELCRVLAPGGRLILGTPDYDRWQWVYTEKLYGLLMPGGYADEHISHYTFRELVRLFEARGYQLEEYRYILKAELILAFRKPPTTE